MSECPHCGQPMLVKFGVRLPPFKARILEMVENVTKGRGGIEIEQLAWVFYPGVPKKKAHDCIKNHVHQINDLLLSTDYRIVSRDGRYVLTESAEVAA